MKYHADLKPPAYAVLPENVIYYIRSTLKHVARRYRYMRELPACPLRSLASADARCDADAGDQRGLRLSVPLPISYSMRLAADREICRKGIRESAAGARMEIVRPLVVYVDHVHVHVHIVCCVWTRQKVPISVTSDF
jgi:hypothetical protein